MNDFEILLSEKDILITNGANVDTFFCVRLGETYFPDPEWTDLTLAVLSMWAENLIRIHAGLNGVCRLSFMDGPYYLELAQTGDELCITAVSDRSRRSVEAVAHCRRGDVIHELIKAFSRLDYMICHCESASDAVRSMVHDNAEHYRTLLKRETAAFFEV